MRRLTWTRWVVALAMGLGALSSGCAASRAESGAGTTAARSNPSATLLARARDNGWVRRDLSPQRGDVVFFSSSPDHRTAVTSGIVERVEPDATAVVRVSTRAGPLHLRMNLAQPKARRSSDGTRVLNHYLRAHHTTAELVVAVAQIPPGQGTALAAR